MDGTAAPAVYTAAWPAVAAQEHLGLICGQRLHGGGPALRRAPGGNGHIGGLARYGGDPEDRRETPGRHGESVPVRHGERGDPKAPIKARETNLSGFHGISSALCGASTAEAPGKRWAERQMSLRWGSQTGCGFLSHKLSNQLSDRDPGCSVALGGRSRLTDQLLGSVYGHKCAAPSPAAPPLKISAVSPRFKQLPLPKYGACIPGLTPPGEASRELVFDKEKLARGTRGQRLPWSFGPGPFGGRPVRRAVTRGYRLAADSDPSEQRVSGGQERSPRVSPSLRREEGCEPSSALLHPGRAPRARDPLSPRETQGDRKPGIRRTSASFHTEGELQWARASSLQAARDIPTASLHTKV
ncbi:hypothetical protein AAFF_G00020850 [Aldrovandia affinis]|uniref:Uncharacterized protein n=1 Tax=Aldrovandia affinis TaxID=143900 RepID=A0AAD7S599_9TELE|nr:hypothetical protein AAFF_G00020850 [Aldrovandia affinis]